MLAVFGMVFVCETATAQQYTHGDCSPNVNGVGGNVNITCNPIQRDPRLVEEEWQASQRRIRAAAEAERLAVAQRKRAYRAANGGCELGTHPHCVPGFPCLCEGDE